MEKYTTTTQKLFGSQPTVVFCPLHSISLSRKFCMCFFPYIEMIHVKPLKHNQAWSQQAVCGSNKNY